MATSSGALSLRGFDERGLLAALDWLLRLRWCALAGQLGVFVSAYLFLDGGLAVWPMVVVALVLSATNLSVYALLRVTRALREDSQRLMAALLLTDVGLLTTLLHFYGGYTNPFCLVYLAHVVLAAFLLGRFWTWGISALSIVCYASLFVFYHEVPALSHDPSHSGAAHHGGSAHEHHVDAASSFNLHLHGMLIAFILCALLLSYFLLKMRAEIDSRDRILERSRAREEKLAALTALSTSVAHEIRTPLASIQLAVDELRNTGTKTPNESSELAFIAAEVQRASRALTRLGGKWGDLSEERNVLCSGETLRGEVEALLPAALVARLSWKLPARGDSFELQVLALSYVMEGLIRNAAEASQAEASIEVSIAHTVSPASQRMARVVVRDSGAGMSREEIARIGEPFFTTKDSSRGMGLGLFIARLFVERLGGELLIESTVGQGTEVTLLIPQREASERSAA